MSKRHTYSAGAATIVSLLTVAITVSAVLAVSWTPAVNMSNTEPIQSTDRVDVAAATDDVAVIWASSQPGVGVTIMRRQGDSSTWGRMRPGTPLLNYVWSPTIVHSGSRLAAAWAEGTSKTSCAAAHQVVFYDVDSGSKQPIINGLWSPAAAPDMAVGDSGWHMVFVGSATQADCVQSKVNLYYSHRTSATDAWSPPEVIATHSEVLEGAKAGGIAYPKVATVNGAPTVHVVWEQFQLRLGPIVDYSVWSKSGVTVSDHTTWSSPTRMSPEDQVQAVRPAIAASETGTVHISWTNIKTSADQEIYYRSLLNPAAVALNPEFIHATSNFPTYAGSAIVARGSAVCTAWYGYTADVGTDSEEIVVKCSNDDGVSWQNATNVSESRNLLSIFPAVAMDTTGVMHFVWTEHELTETSDYKAVGVFYRNSDESSSVFLPAVMRGN